MKSEYKVCQVCPINRTCHQELVPEVLTPRGLGRKIPTRLKFPKTTLGCRHFTCDTDGRLAAIDAKSNKRKRPFIVTEYDGKRHFVMGSTFGSQFKDTARHSLRIIAANGDIYSKQGRFFYSTGKNFTTDRSRSSWE